MPRPKGTDGRFPGNPGGFAYPAQYRVRVLGARIPGLDCALLLWHVARGSPWFSWLVSLGAEQSRVGQFPLIIQGSLPRGSPGYESMLPLACHPIAHATPLISLASGVPTIRGRQQLPWPHRAVRSCSESSPPTSRLLSTKVRDTAPEEGTNNAAFPSSPPPAPLISPPQCLIFKLKLTAPHRVCSRQLPLKPTAGTFSSFHFCKPE